MAEENTIPGAEDQEDLDPQEGQQEPAQTQGFMTADQVNDMLERHTRMMMQQNEQYLNTVQQIAQPQPPVSQEPQVQMPTQDEVREAFETGDGSKFMDVYNRSLAAVHNASQQQVRALEAAGMERINQLSQEVVKSTVPDYQTYEKEVDRLATEYGVSGDLRSNPKVVQLLVNAAKGEHLEQEVERRMEARARQAAQRQTPDPTTGREPASQPVDQEPLFSMAALQALRNAGRSPDQHAQQMGYANWDEYNAATAEKYSNWESSSVPYFRRSMDERMEIRRRRRMGGRTS